MTSKAAPQGRWADLPLEVWGRILVLAYQTQYGGGMDDYAPVDLPRPEYFFPELYQQLLVCKNIKAAFFKESWLYRDLLVPAKSVHTQALQAWIQNHHAAIENVIGGTDSHTDPEMEYKGVLKELALVELHRQSACLRCARISGASHVTVILLSTFNTMTQCTFHRPKGFEAELSLHPLQELPHLVKLELEIGTYQHVAAAKYLTCLTLADADGDCAQGCAFVSSLIDLDICLGGLTSFPADGLAMCSRLHSFRCSSAGITADEYLDDENGQYSVFTALSALSNLTYLCLGFENDKLSMECTWLASLPALQHMLIWADVKLIDFPDCVSTLTNLESLSIDAGYGKGQAVCNFDWMKLTNLQRITLQNDITFARGLSDLAALTTLSQVKFCRIQQSDAKEQVASLQDQFRRTRPYVSFLLKCE